MIHNIYDEIVVWSQEGDEFGYEELITTVPLFDTCDFLLSTVCGFSKLERQQEPEGFVSPC